MAQTAFWHRIEVVIQTVYDLARHYASVSVASVSFQVTTMIQFEDFLPEVKDRGFFSTEYETLHETLQRVNQWITDGERKLINIETVLLPNVEDGTSTTTHIRTSGKVSSYWQQIVRVWYRDDSSGL